MMDAVSDKEGPSGPDERRSRSVRRTSATATVVMRGAAEQLGQLLGVVPSSVSSLQRSDDGWVAHVEVVEIERIPDTTSVMARYRVALDQTGDLQGYAQIRRYTRGQIDRE